MFQTLVAQQELNHMMYAGFLLSTESLNALYNAWEKAHQVEVVRLSGQ